MLESLARGVVRRRIAVLVLAAVAVVLAFAVGVGVFASLKGGGFTDPGSDSAAATAALEETFGAQTTDVVVVARTADRSPVSSPAATAAGEALVAELAARPDVAEVTSWWDARAPGLASSDGTAALVTVVLAGDESERLAAAREIAAATPATSGPLELAVGGTTAVFAEVNDTIQSDLARAESIAIPLTMLLLLLVFGTLVASGLPMVIALTSVAGSFLVLFVLTRVTDVSIFAVNLVTSLGLGLAIDYALFITTRFREELRAGYDPDTAVVRSVRTAGRTVLFSGLTVAVSLAALLVFPQYFLRSFAYAGIATTVLAVVGAIVVLPALLAVLGTRVNRYRVLRSSVEPTDDGFWFRLSHSVMRRPWPFLVGSVAFLALLGLPFLSASFGQTDDRVLPASASSAQASDQVRELFDSRETTALQVVAPTAKVDAAGLSAYALALSQVDGVRRVDTATGSFSDGRAVLAATPASARFSPEAGGTWLTVVTDVETYSDEGQRVTADVRAVTSPLPGTVVGGPSADFADSQHALSSRLPWALGIIAVATFVLLFLFTGSVVLPLKALVLSLLSLSATFGAMVWIFQEGHLSGLLGDFQVTGSIDTAMPILMFCIAFGLSMDYEVFLLSRIKEEYDLTGDNTHAVAVGLQKTGKLVTAAAALLAVVFLAFATSEVTIIKMLGVGVALAVIIDATVVRGLLMPAFMRLLGDRNWWAPAPLRRLHDRIGLRELALPDEPLALAADATPAAVR